MAAVPSDATRKRSAWLDRLEAQSNKKSRTGAAVEGQVEEETKQAQQNGGAAAIKTESGVQPMHTDTLDVDASSAAAAPPLSSASSSSAAASAASSSSSSAAALHALSSSTLPAIKTEPGAPSSSLATLSAGAAAHAVAAPFSSPASSAFNPSSTAPSSASTAAAPSSAESSLSSVASLSAMGFDARIVAEALKRSGGNMEGALEMMLAGVIEAKPAAQSSSAMSPSLGSMLRSPDRPAAAAAAAASSSSAAPNAPPRAMPTTLGTVRFDSIGWITWKPSGSGASSCTCRKGRPSGAGSNIVTLSSLSAAAAASSSCAACSLASLEPLPSTLAAVRFSPEGCYRTKFDSFVALYRPSQIRADQCAWIVVRMPGDEANEDNWIHTFGMERLQDEWNRAEVKNAATIRALASRSGYVSGKWMIMPGAVSVDAIWRSVSSAIVSGVLRGVRVAKVSPANGPGGAPTHVICIYTRDWTDEADVMRVRELLRTQCNVHWKINYKADIYTSLGIYVKNPLKIKATVYTV